MTETATETATEKPSRYTVPMPGDQAAELEDIADRTGLPVAALLRQGAVRVILEFRETKSVSSQALEPLTAA